MVADGAFSHKIDYVSFFQEILNPEGYPNCTTGTTVTDVNAGDLKILHKKCQNR